MLTPLDIESKVFSKSVGGYSVSEVKIFMKEVLSHYEKLYKENIELKDKLNTINEGIQYYKNIEETLQHTLLLAEKMAEETRATARKNSEQIEREAQLKADVIINDAKNEVHRINAVKDELIHAYDASKIQLKQFLKSQLELVERVDLDLQYHQSAYEKFLKNGPMDHFINKSKEVEPSDEKDSEDPLADEIETNLDSDELEEYAEDEAAVTKSQDEDDKYVNHFDRFFEESQK